MAGFEVIVRPVVFPSIRPQPARALPPEDNPEQGIATISGSAGKMIDLPYSFSVSKSRSPARKEKARASDHHRIYQKEGRASGAPRVAAQSLAGPSQLAAQSAGEINRDNYVDVASLHHVLLRGQDDEEIEEIYERVKEADNIELLRKDVVEWAPET